MGEKIEIINTKSERETVEFARGFARRLNENCIVLLYGTLGMGKSVISRTIIRTLCGNDDLEVPSPTFTLVQTYESQSSSIWHFDLYRLADVSEIYEIGWEEALNNGILLVEWSERLGDVIPPNHIELHINNEPNVPGGRIIEVRHVTEN